VFHRFSETVLRTINLSING